MGAHAAQCGGGVTTRGLLLGHFMPPHVGHVFLGESALALVDELTILVCAQPGDMIGGDRRVRWMREIFPRATVLLHDSPAPEPPADHPEFWTIWRDIIRAAHPAPIDMLFAPERLCGRLAVELGAWSGAIDPARATIPVTSAAIRSDPFEHWRFIPPPVRPHYAKTICLHGPESTGKSTLAPKLAAHFETIYVPEYGRTHCESFGLALTMDDLTTIAHTHCAMTHAALRQCNRRLILDTDPLMTAVWADMLFGHRDPWFQGFTATADFYLLLDIDMPWIDDGTRFFGDAERRQRFFDLSRAELDRRGLPYAIVGGRAPQRFDLALEAIAAAGLG